MVALRSENVAKDTTKGDAKGRVVLASGGMLDPVEAALVRALDRASDAGRFDVVGQLADELHARRLARGRIVELDPTRRTVGLR
jgi:hypothetical protein